MVAVLARGACAATPTTGPAERGEKGMGELIKELDSADYATRESATDALMHCSADQRPAIEAALMKTTSREAIARLEKVAVHLYMKERTSLDGKVGLMGVSMSAELIQLDPKSQNFQNCIVVWKTQPGFPAAEELKPGDRLIALNGERFPADMSREEFRKAINVAGGGAVLTFTLVRDGKTMDARVKLAGLREEDVPFIMQIVETRDRIAEEYRASLRTGRTAAAIEQNNPPARTLNDRNYVSPYDAIPR